LHLQSAQAGPLIRPFFSLVIVCYRSVLLNDSPQGEAQLQHVAAGLAIMIPLDCSPVHGAIGAIPKMNSAC
jgi:hypothetical protein